MTDLGDHHGAIGLITMGGIRTEGAGRRMGARSRPIRHLDSRAKRMLMIPKEELFARRTDRH